MQIKKGWQRRYEALRAMFVDRLPQKAVADKFGYTPGYTRLLRHQFVHGKISLAEIVSLADLDGQRLNSDNAGVFLFAFFLRQLNIGAIARAAGLPGSKIIPATNYLLSFLALKLIGNERYAHVGDHTFDPALGLFAGLNALPKCTAMSTYSYALDEMQILNLQKEFIHNASKLGLYDGKLVHFDFHTVPHFGEQSVLEKHWAGACGKRMKGALTLFCQDSESKLILYINAHIRRSESDDQVTQFLSFYNAVHRGVKPTLVFDLKFTSDGGQLSPQVAG